MYCQHCQLNYLDSIRICERCGETLIPVELDQLEQELNETDTDEEKEGSLASFFSHEPIPKTKIYSRRM